MDKEIVPGLTSVAAPGHTPGHTAYMLSSGSGKLMIMSDMANHPALFVRNPDWSAVFDMDAESGAGHPPPDARHGRLRAGAGRVLPCALPGDGPYHQGRRRLPLRAGAVEPGRSRGWLADVSVKNPRQGG